jgi:hypothetical protein
MDSPRPQDTFETDVPARLDRLPWSRFYWLVVFALGITWILDGLEVTMKGAVKCIKIVCRAPRSVAAPWRRSEVQAPLGLADADLQVPGELASLLQSQFDEHPAHHRVVLGPAQPQKHRTGNGLHTGFVGLRGHVDDGRNCHCPNPQLRALAPLTISRACHTGDPESKHLGRGASIRCA